MATIRNSVSGDSFVLRAHHVFGRDASRCDTVIQDGYVSRVHAIVRFAGGLWRLQDQSSNGTLISGASLRDGEQATLRHGDVICFGKPGGVCWEVEALDDPIDMLWPVRPPASPIALEFAHVLPGEVAPAVSVMRSASNEWLCDDRGALRVLRHGDLVTSGALNWRLALARRDTITLGEPFYLVRSPERIDFAVSRDEEHVRAVLHTRGAQVDLGERAHHYCLVTLARVRYADMQAGYDSASQGWVEVESLARMLGIEAAHVNVQIHRARAQFVSLPAVGSFDLIERRRGSVRFGAIAFRVFRGDQLECQWTVAEPLRAGLSFAAPIDELRHAPSN